MPTRAQSDDKAPASPCGRDGGTICATCGTGGKTWLEKRTAGAVNPYRRPPRNAVGLVPSKSTIKLMMA